MADRFPITLTTSITLAEQLRQALSAPTTTPPADAHAGKDALPLLSAAATALRAQVTKLSLLAITAPFTPSAAVSVLSDLNESVLPTLASAALLVSPEYHTKAFQTEVRELTKTTFNEVLALLGEVKNVSAKKDEENKAQKKETDLPQAEKDVVTVATGRVWNSCDVLVDVAAKGVVGFVVRRAEQWRDLVRDAVEEIEEWDPDEEGDEFFDELLSDDGKADTAGDDDDDEEEEGEGSAALHEQKKTTLRILKPVAQIYPVVISHRIKKAVESPEVVKKLESLMKHLQRIPEGIDEVAGALYEEDWQRCTQHLRKAKAYAVQAVNLVVSPLDASSAESQQTDDKFATWSKTWMKVMDEVSKPVDSAGSGH